MTDLLGSILVDAIVPRWKQYALGSVLLLASVGAGLLLISQPHLIDAAHCGGWRLPVCLPLQHGEAGRWALGTGLMAVVVAVAAVAHSMQVPLLALLTGAGWPDWRLVRWWGERRRRAHHRAWQRLGRRWPDSTGTFTGTAAAVRAHERWRLYPSGRIDGTDLPLTAPTLIGNIIAAGRQRITEKFGIDLAVCWGPLTAALPETGRVSLAESTNVLHLRVQHFALALLTPTWLLIAATAERSGTWRLLVVLIVAGVCGLALACCWWRLRTAVVEYVELIENLTFVHRRQLYAAAGVDLPTSTAAERDLARQLSDDLREGPELDRPLTWPPPHQVV